MAIQLCFCCLDKEALAVQPIQHQSHWVDLLVDSHTDTANATLTNMPRDQWAIQLWCCFLDKALPFQPSQHQSHWAIQLCCCRVDQAIPVQPIQHQSHSASIADLYKINPNFVIEIGRCWEYQSEMLAQ